MQAMWSTAQARISHRLAMHVRIAPVRLLNDAPMVSFTFDDTPKSAATTGAAILRSHDAFGTFYVAGSLVGGETPDWQMVDADDVRALHAQGQEIGCHTFSHTRACDLDEAQMGEEIARNRRYLQSLDPSIKIENFAYPYGFGSIRRKRQLRTAFRSCRGIVPGVNAGNADLQFLQAMPLLDRGGIERALDEALASNGWLIFYTHDVAERPSPFGCTPALLDFALTAARRRGISALTMAEALRCAGV